MFLIVYFITEFLFLIRGLTTLQLGLRIRCWVGILFCEARLETEACTRTLLCCWLRCFVRNRV